MKVLIVEDTAVTSRLVRALVEGWGYEATTVESGEDALALMAIETFDIMVCDWMLPGISGPDLCRRVRAAEHEDGPYLYVIILTARGGGCASTIQGLEAGADDYVDKPFEPEELRLRLAVGRRILTLKKRLAERGRALALAVARSEADMAAAERVHRAVLPPRSTTFGRLRASSLFRPSGRIGGDLLNYFRLTDRHVAFHSVDIAGHGTPAALIALAVHYTLAPARLLLEDGTPRDPAAVVAALNTDFQAAPHTMEAPYLTMVYGVIDIDAAAGSLCLAGHPPPLRMDARGAVDRIGESGFPVGLLPDASYVSTPFSLRRDRDTLIVHSDGLSDTWNADRPDQPLEAGLRHMLDRSPARDLDRFVDDLSLRYARHEDDTGDAAARDGTLLSLAAAAERDDISLLALQTTEARHD